MSEFFSNTELVKQNGDKVNGGEALNGKKVVGLYFSAMWCGSCRQFTPKLKRFYETLKKAGKEFEIVFVSRDHEEDDLMEYLEHGGDWLAIPFGNDRIAECLQKYEVQGIPAFVIIGPHGEAVVSDGKKDVQDKGKEDPNGLYDEWLKKIESL